MKILHKWFESLNLHFNKKGEKYDYFYSFNSLIDFFKLCNLKIVENTLNYTKERKILQYINLPVWKMDFGDEIKEQKKYYFDGNYNNIITFLFEIYKTSTKCNYLEFDITKSRRMEKCIIYLNYKNKKGEDLRHDILTLDINLDRPEKLGLYRVKFHGKFEPLLEYLELLTILESYKNLLKNINISTLSRIDINIDFVGSSIKKMFKFSKLRNLKKWLAGGWIDGKINNDNTQNVTEKNTIYWWDEKSKRILVRCYNKFNDSLKKEKLHLYEYVNRLDVLRLEFQIMGKIIRADNNSLGNINIWDYINYVYTIHIINSTDKHGYKNYYFDIELPALIIENEKKIEKVEKTIEKVEETEKETTGKKDLEYVFKVLYKKLENTTPEQRKAVRSYMDKLIENWLKENYETINFNY